MKITLLQQDIVWGDPETNRKKAEKLMAEGSGTELYVLPEMFSTGFMVAQEPTKEPVEGDTLRWMKQQAAIYGAAIGGSVAVTDGERLYNRFYFVKPDGSIEHYDKRHLFTYSGENKWFTPGEKRVVVTFRGVRFLLEVCYDLRFPVWTRNKGDYDAIIYVANWPVSRAAAWQVLLRARAIENQCFVVGVNRVGCDPFSQYKGGSVLLNPYGEPIVACEEDKEQAMTGRIELNELEEMRRKFPVLNDADRFSL